MNCPYCGAEMEEGYLQSGRILIWSAELLSGFMLPMNEGDFKASAGWGLLGASSLPSSYCEACNILISKPEKKPKWVTPDRSEDDSAGDDP